MNQTDELLTKHAGQKETPYQSICIYCMSSVVLYIHTNIFSILSCHPFIHTYISVQTHSVQLDSPSPESNLCTPYAYSGNMKRQSTTITGFTVTPTCRTEVNNECVTMVQSFEHQPGRLHRNTFDTDR